MKDVLTVKQASEYLQIPERTLQYLIYTKQIDCYSRVGKRSIRFRKDNIDKWMDERQGIELRYDKSGSK